MDFIKSLAKDFELLRYIMGFALIPYAYIRQSIFVQKELELFFEKIRNDEHVIINTRIHTAAIVKIKNLRHIFQLEWWLVAAITVFLIFVYQLGDIALSSKLMSCDLVDASACSQVKGMLNLFSVSLSVLGIFLVYWIRSQICREIANHAYKMAQNLLPYGGKEEVQMPPSGYSPFQCNQLKTFLKSCSEALETEGKEAGLTPSQALQKECNDIDQGLKVKYSKGFARPTLVLTKEFYMKILQSAPTNYIEYREIVERALEEMDKEILAIHIEQGELSPS